MRLTIYRASALRTGLLIDGYLVVANKNFYIIPIDTDMITHNNPDDNVFIHGVEVDANTIQFLTELSI